MTVMPTTVGVQDFRRACSLFATGVAVVTARLGAARVGMTINSFASVSLEPPLVLWSLRETSRSRPVFEEAGHFAINILSAEQMPLAQHFAKGAEDVFDGHELAPSMLGLPLLTDALAHLECRTRHIYDAGDHRIFVGEVVGLTARDGSPLVFYQGRFTPGLPDLNVSGVA